MYQSALQRAADLIHISALAIVPTMRLTHRLEVVDLKERRVIALLGILLGDLELAPRQTLGAFVCIAVGLGLADGLIIQGRG